MRLHKVVLNLLIYIICRKKPVHRSVIEKLLSMIASKHFTSIKQYHDNESSCKVKKSVELFPFDEGNHYLEAPR